MLDMKVWFVPQKPRLNLFQHVEPSFLYYRRRDKLYNETVLALQKRTPTHNYMKYTVQYVYIDLSVVV
jgi:hypothetical protein